MIEQLYELLKALGLADMAEGFMHNHAESDEAGDDHKATEDGWRYRSEADDEADEVAK